MSTRPEGFWTWIKSCYSRKRDGQQIGYYLVNHCSSEGETVGIKSYLLRLKFQFNRKISKPKTISVQFQIKIHFNFILISIPKIIFQNSFQFIFKNQNKMSENIELSYVWDHTIMKILNHDSNLKWET